MFVPFGWELVEDGHASRPIVIEDVARGASAGSRLDPIRFIARAVSSGSGDPVGPPRPPTFSTDMLRRFDGLNNQIVPKLLFG